MEGPDFLRNKYELHNAPEVESAAERTEARTGESVPKHPSNRIQNYLDRFNEILEREDPEKRERGVDAIKQVLYDKFVIKPEEIPEAFFSNQQRLAREQGHGDIEIGAEQKEQLAEVIVTDQKSSLDTWIDYLSSRDATYPDWLKYFAVRSILGMGEYDKEKHQFTKRSKGTTKPFPDLNREALAYVLHAIGQKGKTGIGTFVGPYTEIPEEDIQKFEKLLQGENFAKLYAWAIDKCTPASMEALADTRGEWVKYEQGKDHMELVKSLQGHGTGWCTAGESTAEVQLKAGDFYVFYSLDKDGKSTVPRAAIRMEGKSIAEVRGVAAEQNLDQFIAPVVEAKMKEFPDGEKYEKKSEDMKCLTEIEARVKAGAELSKEDLAFLYEIEGKIEGFGYRRDPRIDELLRNRDVKDDLSFTLGVPKEKISTNNKEALGGGIEYHYGNLGLGKLTSAEGLILPKRIGGDISLDGLRTTEGLTLPESVGGHLYLTNLKSAEGLVFPKSVGGGLELSSLTSIKGLTLPESVGGDIRLSVLTSAEGLTLPESVGGNINLNRLASAEGLTLPESIGGGLYLIGLTSTKGLTLPESIGGDLDLNDLTSTEGLTFPKSVGGHLNLTNLKSAEGLTLPENVGGNLNLNKLKSTKGLVLPKSVGGYLALFHLSSAEDLVLPESIGGNLTLYSLTSARGVTFPKNIGGDISFESLRSAEGLTLPESIGGDLDLNSLTSAEGLKLPKNVGGHLYLNGLKSTKGLTLPESVGSLSLVSLNSAEGLVLPKSIEDDLHLNSLKSTKGLTLPESIGGLVYLENVSPDEGEALRKQFPNIKIHLV